MQYNRQVHGNIVYINIATCGYWVTWRDYRPLIDQSLTNHGKIAYTCQSSTCYAVRWPNFTDICILQWQKIIDFDEFADICGSVGYTIANICEFVEIYLELMSHIYHLYTSGNVVIIVQERSSYWLIDDDIISHPSIQQQSLWLWNYLFRLI